MSSERKTTVCILGAGPAGITLGNILVANGVDCIVVDQYNQEEIFNRGRAGTFEHTTIEALDRHGLGQDVTEKGILSTVCEFRGADTPVIFDFASHSNTVGRYIYPQSAFNDGLIERFVQNDGALLFEHKATDIQQSGRKVTVELTEKESGEKTSISASFVVGCDGFHGITRKMIPGSALTTYKKEFDHQWLAFLAEAPPLGKRVIYATHQNGFAGHIPRTETVTRYYLQIPAVDSTDDWPEDKVWKTMDKRLVRDSETLPTGPIIDKRPMTLRSFAVEPLCYGRLFLAGDAAHIVAPMGGKGMNMAVGDAIELAETFITYVSEKKRLTYLDRYSKARLPKIWKAIEFSNSMLTMTHGGADEFDYKLGQSKLQQLKTSPTFASHFAREFVGAVSAKSS